MALGAAALGTGGGEDGGGASEVGGRTGVLSSTLDSRAWAFSASLCGTEDAMSVS